nr:MAG TPA: hypothetical protein [Bacteriophage sp.]
MVKHYPFLCSNVKYLPKIRFFVVNIWIIRKLVVSLHRLFKKIVRMNLKYELNEKEAELIEAIRNYRLSYPDGYPQLLWYAQQLFDDLVDMPE